MQLYREGIADILTPPTNLKPHIGEAKPKELINREGDHFEDDQQIINFLETLPWPDRIEGEACNTYLQRKESWKSLKKMMKETQGMNIVAYGFRHS